jgi:hypothetical protein
MSKRQGLWEFLNSSFALWLMSAFILSALPFLYSKYESNQRAKLESSRRIQRLDIEIEARLGRLATGLGEFSTWPERFRTALSDIARPERAEYPVHVFPEFKETPLAGLLWELCFLIHSREKSQIRAAAMAAEQLERNYVAARGTEELERDPKTQAANIKAIATALSARLGDEKQSWFEKSLGPLDLPRWGTPLREPIRALREECFPSSKEGK